MADPIQTGSDLPLNRPASILPTPLPTPTHGPGGSFTVACSTTINAPPTVCATVLLRHEQYPAWNRFCRAVTIDAVPSPPATPDPDAIHLEFLRGAPDFLAPGTDMTFAVFMDPAAADEDVSSLRPTALTVSRVERIPPADGAAAGFAGWRVAWKTRGAVRFVLRCERVQELVFAPGAKTEYRCWETFYGVLAPVVRWAVGAQLLGGFDAWMEGLKKEAERQHEFESATHEEFGYGKGAMGSGV